jgi:hypothetical protein
MIAKARAGDHRDPERVHAWTAGVIGQLRAAAR